jgi:ketosteroid isomerase-like protein
MSVDPEAVEVVRRFYRAVADRDLAAAAACFDEHAVWALPGRSLIAGEHHGPDAIRDNVLSKVAPLSGGTFSAELVDVAVGDEHVVAVQHATAEHRGKRLVWS